MTIVLSKLSSISGWRAGKNIWGDEWTTEEAPDEIVRRFRKLRPFMHTGYEAVAMTRMAYEGIEGETIDQETFDEFLQETQARTGYSQEGLIDIFSKARDEWIRNAPDSWFKRNRFYEGAEKLLIEIGKQFPLYIVTTKQRRFAEKLLAEHCPGHNVKAVYGLRDGSSKEGILDMLMSQPEMEDAVFHFVEDRLRTLQRTAEALEGRNLKQYLAGWGYNTPEDRKTAADEDAIVLLDKPNDFTQRFL